ncbi:redoxin family protein [Candidatus Sumerlaeota bacterium]|nr:redoxin family protein [Candidatus Sumerlaeota bacterium]
MRQKKEGSGVVAVIVTVLTLVFVWGVSTGATSLKEETLTTSTLIEKSFSAYEHLKSFYTEGKTTFKMTARGKTQTADFPVKMAFEKPNKFYVKFDHPSMGFEIVSNGKVLYSYLPSLKQYRKLDAPHTIKEIDLEKVIAPGARASGVLMILLSDDPKSAIIRNTTSAKMLPPEELEGKTYYVVQLKQSDKSKVDLYIDPNTFLIKQMNVDMTEAIKSRPSSQKPPADLKITLTEDYKIIKPNEKVSAEVFAFNVPEDAKEVESFVPPEPSREQAKADLKGKKAPEFTLKDIDGNTHSLSEQKGKVVLLDFWATWCGPCRRSMPFIQKLHKRYKDKGLVVWGINAQSDTQALKKFLTAQKITYTILRDTEGSVSREYGVTAIPRILLIDKKGSVAGDYTGFSSDVEKEMEQTIKKILEQ